MNTTHGCNFCRRMGMPLLPIRPAVMAKGDDLPSLPSDFSPSIQPEGETDYTARLLRKGFLYIWSEQCRYWLNYFVTDDGYFYPLPLNGNIPPRLIDGELKPCITQPQELAAASLITLPMKPPGIKNGNYWFIWSEEQWTDKTRQLHEKPEWQQMYMQKFDMDAWLMTHQGQQARSINLLTQTVAEYSPSVRICQMKDWTPTPFKPVTANSASELIKAATSLDAQHGALLLLSDPVAAAMEISSLSRYRFDQAITDNPEFKRGIALSAMLNGLELSVRECLFQTVKDSDIRNEQKTRFGWDSPAGPHFPDPESAEKLHRLDEETRNERVNEVWQHYEKYIDRNQQNEFTSKLIKHITSYNERIIVPMTRMFLNWLQSTAMKSYFIQHFDPTSPHSGARYIQTVFNCLVGMEDKAGVIKFIEQQLYMSEKEEQNYLLRAVFFNNNAWISQFEAEMNTHGGRDWDKGISWDRLADGVKEISQQYSSAINLALERLHYLYLPAIMKATGEMAKGVQVNFAISILAIQGKAFLRIPVDTGTKQYLNALTRGMAGLLEMSGKTGGRLYQALQKETGYMARGISETARIKTYLPTLIDIDEVKKLQALSEHERLAKLGSVLKTEDEIVNAVFPFSTHLQLAKAQGISGNTILSELGHNAFPFAGSTFSALFQGWVVLNGFQKEGWPGTPDGWARFSSNGAMAWAAAMDTLKRASAGIIRLELSPTVTFGARFVLKIASWPWWERLGFLGGAVFTFVEAYEGVTDIIADKKDVGLAHLANGLGVGLMTLATGKSIIEPLLISMGLSSASVAEGSLFALIFGPWGILVGVLLILAANAWLVSQTRNEIQEWLASTLWRRIPDGESAIPVQFRNSLMEKEAFNALSKGNA